MTIDVIIGVLFSLCATLVFHGIARGEIHRANKRASNLTKRVNKLEDSLTCKDLVD